MWRLAIVPVTAWACHGVALARARRRARNSDNLGLTRKRRVEGGRHDGA